MRIAIKAISLAFVLGMLALPMILGLSGYLDWPLWLTIVSPLLVVLALVLITYASIGIRSLLSRRNQD